MNISVRDYQSAEAALQSARDINKGKPVANNTRVVAVGTDYGIKLHRTVIVTYHKDGSITLNSGGWRTVTTRDRINRFSPAKVSSTRGIWYVTYNGQPFNYAEGITLHPDGTVTGTAPVSSISAENKTRKAIAKYAREFTDKLFAGEIPAPGMGDCWGCCMRTDKGERPMGGARHIEAHLTDPYYVPSLLVNALEQVGASQAMRQTATAYMYSEPAHAWGKSRTGFIAKQIERAIRKHCLRELGMAA